MAIRLDSIKGLMVDKKFPTTYQSYDCYSNDGHNKAIELQGSKEITLNREKLAAIIFKCMTDAMTKNEEGFVVDFSAQDVADAIIANEATLLEVKKS